MILSLTRDFFVLEPSAALLMLPLFPVLPPRASSSPTFSSRRRPKMGVAFHHPTPEPERNLPSAGSDWHLLALLTVTVTPILLTQMREWVHHAVDPVLWAHPHDAHSQPVST